MVLHVSSVASHNLSRLSVFHQQIVCSTDFQLDQWKQKKKKKFVICLYFCHILFGLYDIFNETFEAQIYPKFVSLFMSWHCMSTLIRHSSQVTFAFIHFGGWFVPQNFCFFARALWTNALVPFESSAKGSLNFAQFCLRTLWNIRWSKLDDVVSSGRVSSS